MLEAYARVVALGAVVLGALCFFSWVEGAGWPVLVQAVNMVGILVGSGMALHLAARDQMTLATRVFLAPSVVGCTWGIVHAPGALVAVYVLGIGLLVFLGVFVGQERRPARAAAAWLLIYLGATGVRVLGVVPVQVTPLDTVTLFVAPAMLLVILVLAGQITVGRLEDSQARLLEVNQGLERVVAERTIALREALGDAERLLLNVLPHEIADRLRAGESAIADAHGDVTILFADLVGFTRLASQMEPLSLVELLNAVFSAFDEQVQARGLEKIKTIGDAYMVVGGLPRPRADHATAICELALEMQAAVARVNADRGTEMELRIGIHTGSVVAGVIGRSKFSYDLWGDAVNIASRMESHGAPGRVQISATTRDAMGPGFATEARGLVALKGRGELHSWWLLGASEQHGAASGGALPEA